MGLAKHSPNKELSILLFNPLTLQVIGTGVWAGVDSAWEQEKPKARKLLVNRADSHTSGARFVGLLILETRCNHFLPNHFPNTQTPKNAL